jgi:hypothetical protein
VDDSRSYLESLPPSGEGPWQEAYGQGSFLAGKAADPQSGACSGPDSASANDLPFRITVDGEPVVGDTLKPEPDRQRCVDVALAKNEIQVRYDPLQVKPALNTWSYPDGSVRGTPIEFGAYSNYLAWITKAEIRIFSGKRSEGKPIAVVPAHWDGMTIWNPPDDAPAEMVFLLRVYDRKGRFDETGAKPLRLLDKSRPHRDLEHPERERLVGWGQDSRLMAGELRDKFGKLTELEKAGRTKEAAKVRDQLNTMADQEIGRASCRERV